MQMGINLRARWGAQSASWKSRLWKENGQFELACLTAGHHQAGSLRGPLVWPPSCYRQAQYWARQAGGPASKRLALD